MKQKLHDHKDALVNEIKTHPHSVTRAVSDAIAWGATTCEFVSIPVLVGVVAAAAACGYLMHEEQEQSASLKKQAFPDQKNSTKWEKYGEKVLTVAHGFSAALTTFGMTTGNDGAAFAGLGMNLILMCKDAAESMLKPNTNEQEAIDNQCRYILKNRAEKPKTV